MRKFLCASQKVRTLPIWIVDLRSKGSVYRKIFWARPISNFSISRPKGREIEIGDQSLVQKIFRYTDPLPLRSTHSKATDFIQVQALHWTYLILLVYKKLFFELSSCHETSDEILFGFELKNPTIYNIIRWFPGTNDSSTKHLMFQVLFIFHNFLQNSLQK